MEILAANRRLNKDIQGIMVGNEEIKLEIFADDMTSFLRNHAFLPRASHTLSRAPKFPLPLPLSTPATQANEVSALARFKIVLRLSCYGQWEK